MTSITEWGNRKVLVVAPSVTARGGIVSVLRLHMEMPLWREANCELLSTYVDGTTFRKALAALRAYLLAPVKIAKSDIVHVHVAGQFSLLRKLPIALIARLFRKVLVVHVHAFSSESLFEATPSWAIRLVLGHADRIIALSDGWAKVIRDHLPHARVSVIPNPVPERAVGLKDRRRIVLFAGKLEPRKGYLTLLQAAPLVLEKYPDAQFWFAGHGELDAASKEAARLGVTGSVHLLGWTNCDTLNSLYQESTVFCLPSHGEGVPMSVLEAMSHATPVVCTPVGGLPEIIVDGENGLFANVGDATSVGKSILHLLDDPAYASSVACAGRRTVQQVCGMKMVEDRLLQLYQRVTLQQGESQSSFFEAPL
jgi:glycosyltransferase involved in cell wall biosynthesis